MARSKRGFALQQFLPGGITPSSESKPTGVVPESPMSLGSIKDPPFSTGATGGAGIKVGSGFNGKLNLGGGDIHTNPLNGLKINQPPPTTGSKFGDLSNSLSGIKLSGLSGANAGSLLGGTAQTTDWGKLLSYQGYGQDDVRQALAALNIVRPSGGLSGMGLGMPKFGEDWMKQMGLI